MSTAARILIVEDETDIAELVALQLKRHNFDTTVVNDGESALLISTQSAFDLIILDWMLPQISGLEVTRQLRSKNDRGAKTPILMLTARSHTKDIVEGLETGADDFLVKPFDITVLIARVNALLRRNSLKPMVKPTLIEIGNLKIDVNAHEVFCSGRLVPLTISEFRLLEALVANRGTALTRNRLVGQVQGDGVNVIERTIDTHVFGLRKKLGGCASIVETIRGVGYRVSSE